LLRRLPDTAGAQSDWAVRVRGRVRRALRPRAAAKGADGSRLRGRVPPVHRASCRRERRAALAADRVAEAAAVRPADAILNLGDAGESRVAPTREEQGVRAGPLGTSGTGSRSPCPPSAINGST